MRNTETLPHRATLIACIILCVCNAQTVSIAGASAGNQADELLRLAGLNGGCIVYLGCGDGKLLAELHGKGRYVLQGLSNNAATLGEIRKYLHENDLYGPVSVKLHSGPLLPYTDNLINLIIAEDPLGVAKTEMMRVLAPGGTILSRSGQSWTRQTKPRPGNIDEWTHFLHGADGNPVARDTVVGPPGHYQWIAGPRWMRSHESDSSVKALVTAGGRIFHIVDEAPASLLGDHSLPDKWFLAARDAFNGVLLWKIPIKNWGWRMWKPSWFTPRPGNIPLNIQKCLVATSTRVYVTLGYRAAVSEIEASTGRVLRTFEGTRRTAEILHESGKLILTILRDEGACVRLVDIETGDCLWTSEQTYGGTTTDYYRFRAMHGSVTPAKVDPTLNTATDGTIVALLDRDAVVALDFETGKQKWRTAFPLVEADYKAGNIDAGQTVWTGTLIVKDGVVVHASPNQLAAFDADSGEILWKQPKKYLQHLWFEWKDVFVIDGLVWTWSAELKREKLEGSNRKSSWPATVNGYDLRTGRQKESIDLGNIFKTHHHHRCYRNKATSRYILASRRGTEFVDLQKGRHTVHNWVRGTCHLGMMPANGLQYAPPHPCVCYINEKINGFNALASAIATATGTAPQSDATRRTKGPAYGQAIDRSAGNNDWPTFRADAVRSGSTDCELPAPLEPLWRCRLPGKPAAPTVAGSRMFVPVPDRHHLIAIDADNGRQQWHFTADARIDSPPTGCNGMLVFGSADGSVYCLRSDDGRLVWRFRAAPAERFIGAFDQLESAWPVHGSVLVIDDTAYFAAGRSSQLDGGIYLYGLDVTTGEIRCRRHLQGPAYSIDNIDQNYNLPMGALPDVMQAHDGRIHMRELAFDADLKVQPWPPPQKSKHVYSKAGLLDSSYFKRTPWTFGSNDSYARLIVHDARTAYGVRMFDTLRGLDPTVYFVPARKGYLLFAANKDTGVNRWQKHIPIRVTAMAVTPRLLVASGPPDVVDPNDPLGAFEGRKGGVLNTFDKTNGQLLWEYTLPSPPVFNGIAIANHRLYIAMQNGSIACFAQ